MQLQIITPEETFFKGDVDLVRVPGSSGSFAIMHGHAPIISTLEPGTIKIVQGVDERFFDITEQSVVEQNNNKVIIITQKIEESFPIFVR